jgi:hypothetical protein
MRRGLRSLRALWVSRAEATAIYERNAREQIDQLKNPAPSRLGSVLDAIHEPMAEVRQAVLRNRVGENVTRLVLQSMGILDARAARSVDRRAIYARFRAAGHRVRVARDIHRLELHQVDDMVRRLVRGGASLAFAEGAATALLGPAGVAIDIPGLLTIALRTIHEYATYYGFDAGQPDEKAFVVMLLGMVSSPTLDERRAAMSALTRLSLLLSAGEADPEARGLLGAQTVASVANGLSGRLVVAKLAQTIPVLGVGFGGSYNAWFVRTVAQSARQLYRERFLITKHGARMAVPVRVPARA